MVPWLWGKSSSHNNICESAMTKIVPKESESQLDVALKHGIFFLINEKMFAVSL